MRLRYGFWTGFFFPKGTPHTIVRKLNEATTTVLDNPKNIERLQQVGVAPVQKKDRSPEYLTEFLPSEITAWQEAVRVSGIPVE